MPGHTAPRLPVRLQKRLLLDLFSFPYFSPPDYHAPLAEATRGELPCDNTRCDPKLTVGTEIVRELPRPLSNETFTGFDDASIGKSDAWAVNSSERTTGARLLAMSLVPVGTRLLLLARTGS